MTNQAPSDPRPLAFSYLRMSTAAQLKGDSRRRQLELSTRYAEENGLTLIKSLEDIGISAFRGANAKVGALAEFLQAMKDGQVPKGSFLLVESIDRLSRQKILNSLKMFLDILASGINIVTLIDGQTYLAGETDFQQLIITITLMSRANEESETKSKRLVAAWDAKRRQIETKKLTRTCPAWVSLSDDRREYVLNPVKVPIVKKIFDLALDGYGSYSITRLLNAEKVPSFGRSALWIKSYVTKILTERAVLGEFQPHKFIDGKRVPEGQPLSNYFPRIVENKQFYAVQALRRAKAQKSAGRIGNNFPNLFKNIGVCEYCRRPMHYVNKGKGTKGGTYLQCSGSLDGSGCSSVLWRYSHFESSFLYFCSEIDLSSILRETETKGERARLNERIIEAKEQIRALVMERDRIFEILQQSKDSTSFVAQRLDETVAKINENEDKLKQLMSESVEETLSGGDNNSKIKEIIELFRSGADGDNLRFRSVLHSKLFRMIESLRIAAAGEAPKDDAIRDFMLEASADDAAYVERVKKHFSSLAERDQNKFPFFIVTFADGMTRKVTVNPNDPMKFAAIMEVKGDRRAMSTDPQYFPKVWDLPEVLLPTS